MKEKNWKDSESILLDAAGVDRISDILMEWMMGEKVERKNALRCRLSMEGILENLYHRYNGSLDVSIVIGKQLGERHFLVRYQGEEFNPTEESAAEEWTSELLSNLGMLPKWSYKNGVNTLDLKLPAKPLSNEVWLLIAALAAIALGAAQPVLPGKLLTFLEGYIFNTISTVFLGLLGTFAGVVVFLCVIDGICSVGNVAEFSKKGKYLIFRNVGWSYIGAGIAMFFLFPFFSFKIGLGAGDSQASTIMNLLLEMVPGDAVSPFMTGNMLQIVLMAILIGIGIVILDARASKVKTLVSEASEVSITVIDIVCKMLPLYIFASLTLLFWEHGIGIVKTAWKPIVLGLIASLILMCGKVLIVSIKCKVSFFKLIKKTLPSFIIGFTTASSTAAYGTAMEENEKDLGIDPGLSSFGMPIEMIINISTMGAGFGAIIYYLAEFNGVEVSFGWFITTWFIVIILSASMPPVAGGPMVCLSIMLAQTGIPAECLSIAGALAILCDFYMTGCRLVISQMELVLEARHWDMLDYEKLRK